MLRLNNFWYLASPAPSSVSTPIRSVVEGEPIVLFRDRDGRPCALIDRCAHRGMALSRGRMYDGCIQCPYHGWRFDGTGALRGIPALPDSAALPTVRPLRTYPVKESQRHFWIWMGPDEPDGPPFRFPYYDDASWHTTFLHTRIAAPLEACLENFLDVPHKLMLHSGWFQRKSLQQVRARIHRFADRAEVELLEQPLEGAVASFLFGGKVPLRHVRRFILPSTTEIEYAFGGRSAVNVTSVFTQCDEHEVALTTAVSWRMRLPGWLIAPLLRRYYRTALREDAVMLEIQRDQLTRFGSALVMTPADLLSRHMRSLRRRAPGDRDARRMAPVIEEDVILRT